MCCVGLEMNVCNMFSESSRNILKRANQIDLITGIVKGSSLMECAVIAAANRSSSFFKLFFKENTRVLGMNYKMKIKPTTKTT